jgi:hypothetical protein
VRLLMATRRTDPRARDSWSRLASTIQRLDHVTGVLIDRTPNGEATLHLQDLAAETISDGSLQIVRQTYDAPMSDVLRLWSSLSPKWTVGLHDDDTWIGDPVVPAGMHSSVTLYAPNLMVSTDAAQPPHARRPWTSQHALFGAMSPRLQAGYLDYVANAPMTIGGEDLLLLFMAAEMGNLAYNPHFTYIWDASNWHAGADRDAMIGDYTQGFLKDHVDPATAFIIFQSIDRLAACTSIRKFASESAYRRSIRHAIMSFWPVVDHRGKAIYRLAPRRFRVAMLSTRGMRPMNLRLSSTMKALLPKSDGQESLLADDWFTAVNSGTLRFVSLEQVKDDLLPRIEDAVRGNVEFTDQVHFWRARIQDLH